MESSGDGKEREMKLWLKEKGEWKLFENVTQEDLKAREIEIGTGSVIGSDAVICERAWIGSGHWIKKTIDCVVVGPIGSRNEILTGYRHNGGIWCATGCFWEPIKKFESSVKNTYAGTDYETDYLAACQYIRARMAIAKKQAVKK